MPSFPEIQEPGRISRGLVTGCTRYTKRAIRRPDTGDIALTRPPAWQQKTVSAQRQEHLSRRAQHREALKHHADRGAHRHIARGRDRPVLIVVQPDRQQQLEFTLLRLVQPRGTEPLADQMQLRLGHRALQPQHQARVIVTRVIHAIAISDQTVSQRAQIHQVVPVSVSPSQPRDLDPQHQPHVSQADLRHQMLKPATILGLRAATALILVDYHHPFAIPAQ
jgi:hypothetical protein